MKTMKFYLMGLLALVAFAVQAAKIDIVTKLPVLEVYEGHLFHSGVLFVGKSRTTEEESHRVELYNSAGELLAEHQLVHSASYIHKYDPSSVIVAGRAANPYWHTYYTVLSTQAPYTKKTYEFPEEIQVDKFAGTKGNAFFTLLGENKILHQTGQKSSPLKATISGPGYMSYSMDSLFVIENNNILQSGDENLVRIDLKTGAVERVFDHYRQRLARTLALENADLVAVSETDANQVLLIDASTGQLDDVLPIESGHPMGLAELNKCLVVTSEESRHISVYRLHENKPLIAQYDLSELGTLFRKARSVAADPETGTLFARSTYLCSGCAETMSSVVRIEDPQLLKKCE